MIKNEFFSDETQALQTFHEGRHDEYRWIASVNYLLTKASIKNMQVAMKAVAKLNSAERLDLEERLATFRHLQALCVMPEVPPAPPDLAPVNRRGLWAGMGFTLKRV